MLSTCGLNSLQPYGDGLLQIGLAGVAANIGPKHVEIVNVSQQVLRLFQISRPSFVMLRQKILDEVPKALNGDAYAVPGNTAIPLSRLVIKRNRVVQLY